ncbi:MAG: glycosyl transferase [Gammaproteobacteria bacterium RIFCSPHIGHO2_12_FULL_41_15]|nr:MAG: glycosyl transferase [Gammaproteobacteria bacterium RIFCSPHIGHO2_12_FULL_41_15]
MFSAQKVIVIIPVYNEKEVIIETVAQILEVTKALDHFSVEILVFDSHSTDGSAELLKTMSSTEARLHFASEPQKTGLGSAYHQAFCMAIRELNADIVFEFDADGSHQPKYIPAMLELFNLGVDVVVGSRYVKGGSIPDNWKFHRKLLSVTGNWIARVVLTSKYKDFTSGFRATRTTILKKILPTKFICNNYAYKLQLFWLLHQAKARIKEYPIEFIDRHKGYSKFPRNNMWESLHVVLTLRFRTLKRFMAMCVVGTGGAVAQFAVYNFFRQVATPVESNILATECAILFNFLFNNWLTFRSSTKTAGVFALAKKLLKFNFCSLGSMLMQVVWLAITTHYFHPNRMLENVFVGTGILFGSLSNYLLYSRWVWRPAKKRIA